MEKEKSYTNRRAIGRYYFILMVGDLLKVDRRFIKFFKFISTIKT